MSLHGPITICDAAGKVLRVLPVAVATAERDEHEAKRKQRQAIAAAVAKTRMRQERAKPAVDAAAARDAAPARRERTT
jgi:hypothetical protein